LSFWGKTVETATFDSGTGAGFKCNVSKAASAISKGQGTSGFTWMPAKNMLSVSAERRRCMRAKLLRVLAMGMLLAFPALFSQKLLVPKLLAQTKSDPEMPKVGDVAPDFTLKYFDGSNLKDVKLSDYRGKKNVVVAFYIFAFTGG
jgi:hypothetical protein